MNLSSAVTALRLIDGEGNLRQLEQFELGDDFSAYPVHLGALGLVTAIQLKRAIGSCLKSRHGRSRVLNWRSRWMSGWPRTTD